jgi:hypothetical protein
MRRPSTDEFVAAIAHLPLPSTLSAIIIAPLWWSVWIDGHPLHACGLFLLRSSFS